MGRHKKLANHREGDLRRCAPRAQRFSLKITLKIMPGFFSEPVWNIGLVGDVMKPGIILASAPSPGIIHEDNANFLQPGTYYS